MGRSNQIVVYQHSSQATALAQQANPDEEVVLPQGSLQHRPENIYLDLP